jgi:hypothetical protein
VNAAGSPILNRTQSAALDYAGRGWPVIPLHYPKTIAGAAVCSCGDPECDSIGKHPMTLNGLKDATTDPDEIRRLWAKYPQANVGIVTGAESGFIVVDVDPKHDGYESLADLEAKHGPLPDTVRANTGGGGAHLCFAHPGGRVKNNNTGKIGRGIDMKGDGGYIVGAGSLHASGRRYEWADGFSPADAPFAPAPTWILNRLSEPPPRPPGNGNAPASDAGVHWLGKALAKAANGNRNETGLWLACQLRDAGVSMGDAEAVMRAYAERVPAGDHPYRAAEAGASLRVAYSQPPREPAKRDGYSNGNHSAHRNGDGSREQVDPSGPAAAKPDTMGPPIPLDARKAPEMPQGVFIGWHGAMIEAESRAHETPPELAAMLSLAVLASVSQKRFVVRPEKGYFETLALWVVCALLPGNRKSAVLIDLARVLIKWERRQAAKVGEERKIAESKRKTQEARVSELRAIAKKKEGVDFANAMDEIATLDAQLVEIPEVPRLFCQDITPERLGSLLAENMERMTILSDEGGIFDLLGGRYSDGVPNLDLVLQSHNGSPVRVDRGGRPPVVLNHPALSMGLSPQPGVLAGLTKHRGFRDRGLLARALYAVPASRLGYRTLEPCPVPDDVRNAYESAVESLADVPPDIVNGEEKSRVLYLSPVATAAWKSWQREVEQMMREGGRLEHLTDWGGKLPGATARIAGLLHLADNASCPGSCMEIPASPMERAITFARWLVEHALITFDLMGADEGMEAARKLWKAIEAKRQPTFKAADAWIPLKGTFKRAKDAEPGFEVLTEHNYIEELHSADRGKPGRPSRKFRVNPAIVEGWK